MNQPQLFKQGILLLLTSVMLAGCLNLNDIFDIKLFPSACTEARYPQKYKFGIYPITIMTKRTTLKIGDTVFVTARYSRQFFDSLGQQLVGVNEKVSVWLKLDQVKPISSASGPFAIDTTIYKVFDQHFRVVVRKGSPIDVYRYSFERTRDFWELDLLYIAKKAGQYTVSTSFDKIATGEDIRCMLGNVSSYNGETFFESTNNQIRQIYPIATPYTNATKLFGFIINN